MYESQVNYLKYNYFQLFNVLYESSKTAMENNFFEDI